ncbi:MAG: hypothetical protein ACI8W8_004959 [Rhodothermales bacterium]|jgi:hypothetical protein
MPKRINHNQAPIATVSLWIATRRHARASGSRVITALGACKHILACRL